MKVLKSVIVVLVCGSLAFMTGCGVSKDKYNALLNEKVMLEEKVTVLTKSRDALKNEFDSLLKDKMDLGEQVQTLASEKIALKGEYDKILDEKVALKAEYDKLQAAYQELQTKSLSGGQ